MTTTSTICAAVSTTTIAVYSRGTHVLARTAIPDSTDETILGHAPEETVHVQVFERICLGDRPVVCHPVSPIIRLSDLRPHQPATASTKE